MNVDYPFTGPTAAVNSSSLAAYLASLEALPSIQRAAITRRQRRARTRARKHAKRQRALRK